MVSRPVLVRCGITEDQYSKGDEMNYTTKDFYENVRGIISKTSVSEETVNIVIGSLLFLAGACIAIEFMRQECIKQEALDTAIERATDNIKHAISL